jgi:serine phosphatase RsbU (regulator of sigma subunit)
VRRQLPIDGPGAGEAFRTTTTIVHRRAAGAVVWVPLVGAGDRIGVLGATVPSPDGDTVASLEDLAGLLALAVLANSTYSDVVFRTRAREDMNLAATLQWQLLPPLNLVTDAVTIAAQFEPAYEVGGDAFDYALNDDVLHFGTFDAMGHGLQSSLLAATAVGAYRVGRRYGVELPGTLAAMHAGIRGQFPYGTFVTCQLAQLDLATGVLTWVNAGHPAGLLVRGDRVVERLESDVTPPVGVDHDVVPTVHTRRLEPGDVLLYFTDGALDRGGDDDDGSLVELVETCLPGAPTRSEAMRRIVAGLLEARGGHLFDDTAMVLVDWGGSRR